MKFTFKRHRVLASVMGHSIEFLPNTPTHVPPEMVAEVMAAGGEPETEVDLDKPKPEGPQEIVDPVARKAAIFAVYEAMGVDNKREEFTAGGQPHLKAIARRLGWSIHDKERDLTWQEFKTGPKD